MKFAKKGPFSGTASAILTRRLPRSGNPICNGSKPRLRAESVKYGYVRDAFAPVKSRRPFERGLKPFHGGDVIERRYLPGDLFEVSEVPDVQFESDKPLFTDGGGDFRFGDIPFELSDD